MIRSAPDWYAVLASIILPRQISEQSVRSYKRTFSQQDPRRSHSRITLPNEFLRSPTHGYSSIQSYNRCQFHLTKIIQIVSRDSYGRTVLKSEKTRNETPENSPLRDGAHSASSRKTKCTSMSDRWSSSIRFTWLDFHKLADGDVLSCIDGELIAATPDSFFCTKQELGTKQDSNLACNYIVYFYTT